MHEPDQERQLGLPFGSDAIPRARRRPRGHFFPYLDSAEPDEEGQAGFPFGADAIPSECGKPRRLTKLEWHLARARDRGRPATLTRGEWLAALVHFDRSCAYCGTAPAEVIEHVVDLEAGGGTTAGNCVPACSSCNSLKQERGPEWVRACHSAEAYARILAYLEPRMTEKDRAAFATNMVAGPEGRSADLVAFVRAVGDADTAARALGYSVKKLRRAVATKTVSQKLAQWARDLRARILENPGSIDVILAETELAQCLTSAARRLASEAAARSLAQLPAVGGDNPFEEMRLEMMSRHVDIDDAATTRTAETTADPLKRAHTARSPSARGASGPATRPRR